MVMVLEGKKYILIGGLCNLMINSRLKIVQGYERLFFKNVEIILKILQSIYHSFYY